MGKSILELFQKEKVENFNVTPGVPVATEGSTLKEKYDIRNSKDIEVNSSSALLSLSFNAYNKLRRLSKERKSETLLEQELVGIRRLRTLTTPLIYGSDLIRLTLESTPDVEKMKNSANGGEGSGITKFGQSIKNTRDKVNKFLGIPLQLNPTEYYKKFDEDKAGLNPVYDRMIELGDIKDAAAGSLIGKTLKNSRGNISGIGKQVIGNALSETKKELRKKILGIKGQSENGNNDFSRLDDEGEPYILYSQYEKYSIGKAGVTVDNPNEKYNLKDKYKRKLSFNNEYPNIKLGGELYNSKNGYASRLENFDLGENGGSIYTYNLNNKYFIGGTNGEINYAYTNYGKQSGNKNKGIASKLAEADDNENLSLFKQRDYKTDSLKYEGFEQTLKKTLRTWEKDYNNPIITKNTWYDYRIFSSQELENAVTNDRLDPKNNLFIPKYFPYDKFTRTGSAYTQNNDKLLNEANQSFENREYANAKYIKNGKEQEEIIIQPGKGIQKTIKIDELRPSFLRNKKIYDGKKIGYSQGYRSDNPTNKWIVENNKAKLNSSVNEESLPFRRGLDSDFDAINQTGVFTSGELANDSINNYNNFKMDDLDLIPLKFQKINDSTTIYMRSIITNYQESNKPNWESKQFVGNPFKFYSFTDVERTLSFDLQIYSMSQLELLMMWRKIEYLTSLAYPHTFDDSGVTPVLFNFTLGNLFINKPCIITSINYSLDDEKAIWELGNSGQQDNNTKKFFGRVKNPDKLNKNWSGIFSTGNGAEKVGYSDVKGDVYFQNDRDSIENDGYGYKVVEQGINKDQYNYLGNFTTGILSYKDPQGDEIGFFMDKYKLPRIIKASMELTFLLSNSNTQKLYNYGETIS